MNFFFLANADETRYMALLLYEFYSLYVILQTTLCKHINIFLCTSFQSFDRFWRTWYM